jgi:DNA-binding Lrp family transcriptional regulator
VSFDELVFFGAVLLFSVTAVFSASIYYNRIRRVKEEGIDLLKAILLPFNKQQQNFETRLSSAVYDIERVRAQVENSIDRIKHQGEEPVKNDYLAMERLTKELTEQMIQLDGAQKALHEQVKAIEKRPLQRMRPERDTAPIQSTVLTKTEKKILEVLYTDGPTTAPKIEKVIQKTREHTSRLMKKLWLEGFIEREVHVIPYMYRPTKKLVERFKDVH